MTSNLIDVHKADMNELDEVPVFIKYVTANTEEFNDQRD